MEHTQASDEEDEEDAQAQSAGFGIAGELPPAGEQPEKAATATRRGGGQNRVRRADETILVSALESLASMLEQRADEGYKFHIPPELYATAIQTAKDTHGDGHLTDSNLKSFIHNLEQRIASYEQRIQSLQEREPPKRPNAYSSIKSGLRERKLSALQRIKAVKSGFVPQYVGASAADNASPAATAQDEDDGVPASAPQALPPAAAPTAPGAPGTQQQQHNHSVVDAAAAAAAANGAAAPLGVPGTTRSRSVVDNTNDDGTPNGRGQRLPAAATGMQPQNPRLVDTLKTEVSGYKAEIERLKRAREQEQQELNEHKRLCTQAREEAKQAREERDYLKGKLDTVMAERDRLWHLVQKNIASE